MQPSQEDIGGAGPAAAGQITETPDTHGAYPHLGVDQLAALEAVGRRRPTTVGDLLFREGDRTTDFFVVLSGLVASVDGYGTARERQISLHGERRFLGELSLLSGQTAFTSVVVRKSGEVLAVPLDRLRRLVATDPGLGDLVLRAYLVRRWLLIGLGAGLRIVGSRYSPQARRLRDFAARNRLPHQWVCLENDPSAEELLRTLAVEPADTPVVVWGRRVLRNPSIAELARAVGLPVPAHAGSTWDLIVVGAGPAGLAASVYGASEGLATVTLDCLATGGQAATSPRIENYLGFPSGISGGDLAERAVLQAEKFGACLSMPSRAVALGRNDGLHQVTLDNGETLAARTVVIATGVRYRELNVPGLQEFEGTSVFRAATLVEAQTCRGDPVVVIGGGNSAGQAALYLAQHAGFVRLCVRHGDLSRDMSRYLVDQIVRIPSIEVRRHREISGLRGGGTLEAVILEDKQTGAQEEVPARALFVFIGARPHTDWLADQVALDDRGFVRTGVDAEPAAEPSMAGDGSPDPCPLVLETSRRGVFAVGDVRSGSVKRVASAVGEGAMAVRLVHERLYRA